MSWAERPGEFYHRDEFRCQGDDPYEYDIPCGCGGSLPKWDDRWHPLLFDLLDHLRRRRTGPLRIVSGYRCAAHPLERVKGRPGAHNLGLAADLALGADSCKYIYAVQDALFWRAKAWDGGNGRDDIALGIGLQFSGRGKRFHIDIAGHHLRGGRDCMWTY